MAQDAKKASDATKSQQTVAPEKSQKQLMDEMAAALKSGDFKLVSKLSGEIAKMAAAKEKAEHDAKIAKLGEVTKTVQAAIDRVVKKFVDDKVLDEADGVWYAHDFGEKLTTCRLTKSAPRAKGTGGGGGGKRFSVGTKELLEKHGGEVFDADTGQTYQQAWDASTDGNARYAIRVKLLKLANITQ